MAANREKVGQGSMQMLSVTDWMRSLDKQAMVMEKTDQVLIERVKAAEKEKQEIFRREEVNKAYNEKLAKIKKEEKRHLKAAKKVPRTFQHEYEMDKRTDKLLSEKKEVTFKEESPEKEEDAEEETSARFVVQKSPAVLKAEKAEEDGEAGDLPSDGESTVSQNHRETIELVKKFTDQTARKYIRVDLPGSQPLGE